MLNLPVHPPTLRERVQILLATRDNVEGFEEARERVRAKCAEDSAWFINAFGFTFDPRIDAELHDIPFIMYDFQVDTIRWMEDRLNSREDGVIEKSRDMGATWLTVAWLVHGFLFRPGFQALIGSRKEDLVDNWTLDSHFGKIQYFIDKLPYWLLPKGYNSEKHRMKLKIMNPDNGNVIIGESANSDFSRQGRYTVVFFDEAAFWPDLTSALRAAAQATRTRLLVSTPNGQNTFARERFSGRYRVLTLLWRLHPLKDDEWYARETARMSPEDVAQEIDISYHRSARGVVYPEFHNVPTGEYPYVKGYSLFTAWDFGVSDHTAIIWIARNPNTGKVRLIDAYQNSEKSIDFYVPFILGMIPPDNEYDYTMEELMKIHSHAALPKSINFGDPDMNKRSGAQKGSKPLSVIDILSEYNIPIFTTTKGNDFRSRKAMTDQGIKQIEGVNLPHCAEVVEAMLNARFPTRNPDSKTTNEVVKPIHDWTSDFRTALEYYFVNQPPLANFERPAPHRREMAYDRIGQSR